MRLTPATHKAISYACRHFHYSKVAPSATTAGYNVYNCKGEWCGVVLFGGGATINIGKPYGLVQGQVLELTRVALNGKQEHTSQAVAMSLKQLHHDKPMCRLVVSYADCDQSHLGTIYQATNWVYTGLADKGDTYFIIKGKKTHRKSVHSKMVVVDGAKVHCPQTLNAVQKHIDPKATIFKTSGKRKYLMPMDKAMRKQIAPLAQPYPKNDDWVKIDRTKFKEAKNGTDNETE